MSLRCLVAVAGVIGFPIAAVADSADERVARGEQLAKSNRLTEAIAEFKAADRLEPRARHDCLIALAYIRRELWSQSELFLARCKDRADARDPIPDWYPLAEQELMGRIAKSGIAPVAVRVVPATNARNVTITVSSFEPDETFAPRTVFLPAGTHLITATMPGHDPIRQVLTLTGKEPREVVIDFDERGAVGPISRSHLVPWSLILGGGAIMLGGVAYHVFAYSPVRDQLAEAADDPDPTAYDRLSGEFDDKRRNTLLLYGVGAALAITGVVLRYTVFDEDSSLRIAAAPLASGGFVAFEWSR